MDNKDLNESASQITPNEMPTSNPELQQMSVTPVIQQETQSTVVSNTIEKREDTFTPQQMPPITEMPKKESNIKFNSEEQILYKVEEEKTGSPIVVAFFMIALCAFVFFLPTISKKANNFLKTNNFIPNNNQPIVPTTPEEENKQLNFHEKGSVGSLEFTNLVKSHEEGNYELDFTLINTGDSIVLYDTEKIIYRALIHSYTPLASKASMELSLTINEKAYKEAVAYQIEEINTSMYPSTTLNKKEGEFDVLTCTYRFNSINYYFKEDNLLQIKEETSISMDDDVNYTLELLNYQAIVNTYKQVPEMNATLVENPTNFKLVNEFKLADIQDNTLSNLKVYKYFRFRETVDIVAFEMEARGYTCS